MSFHVVDEDKWIDNLYWVCLEEVSLDFDSSWTGSEVEICKEDFWGMSKVVKGCRRWVGPRSLEWVPSTRCFVDEDEEIHVQYGEDNDGPPHTSVIARWKDVKALAQGAEYQDGSARLEIKRDFRCGASTVRMIVRKVDEYSGNPFFKLSVVIEDIRRDEWNNLLEYQQSLKEEEDSIVEDVPYTFRRNECIIEQTPKSPWQDDRSDVTKDVRHVALESLPLVLRYYNAQNEAVEQGLSSDDFLWAFPNHHETRVVRGPSAHTDTPSRALRLDVDLLSYISESENDITLTIFDIELTLTPVTRSPSLPNNLSSCTLRFDPPYAALANASIPNHSSQIIEISPDSQSPGRLITTSGSIHVNGPLHIMGDMFNAPVYGGNVGGHNNTNHSTAPLTADAVFSAVQRAFDTRIGDGGRFVPQTEAGRKCKRDDEEDIKEPSKRQFRPMSFISRFCAALFST